MNTIEEIFTPEEIADNHESFSRRSALYKEFGIDRDALQRSLLNEIDPGNRSMLEIGTGRGLLTIMLARNFDSVVTVDSDAEGQRIARLNAAYYNCADRIQFVNQDASTLAYADAFFDAAVSAFTFHHLEFPFKVIREMIRLARNQIVISDFTRSGFDAINRIHESEGGHHNRGHGDFSIVGPFLKESGFKVKAVETDYQLIYSARRKY